MLVGEDILFSVPFKTRVINALELDALNKLCTTIGLNSVNSEVSGSYCQRISKSGEVFHARTYKRSKKSCSTVVQFCLPNNEKDLRYGEIQEFLCISSLSVAFVKPFTEIVTAFAKMRLLPHVIQLLMNFAQKSYLGFTTLQSLPLILI
jgi:hypothetical protein